MDTSKISLGTVQFGTNYGITNISGKVSFEDVKNILNFAWNIGIKHLDTAQAYGDAEIVIGKAKSSLDFNISSKFSPASPDFQDVERNVRESLYDLRTNSLEILYIHDPFKLSHEIKLRLLDQMLKLKDLGFIKKVGLSIYNHNDINGFDLKKIDAVQLPFSIYDQSALNSGLVDQLITNNVEINLRSIFLQGLLISSLDKWPAWIPKDMLNNHKNLIKVAETNNCSLIDLIAAFCNHHSFFTSLVLGVCTQKELKQLVQSFSSQLIVENLDWPSFDLSKTSIFTDPRNWPSC